METLKEIRIAVWELRNEKKVITVKNVLNQNKNLSFSDLPQIKNYLEEIKSSFLHTSKNGYLELHPMEKVNIQNYITKA